MIDTLLPLMGGLSLKMTAKAFAASRAKIGSRSLAVICSNSVPGIVATSILEGWPIPNPSLSLNSPRTGLLVAVST
jgi:hypothetical protein